MVVLGSAMRPSEINKKLHGYDFVIIIAEKEWENQTDPRKKTQLVDHELCHCWYRVDKQGESHWVIREHDIQEFREILERYGLEDYEAVEVSENGDD